MPGPGRSPLVQLGLMLAALVVFTCGWLAMKTDDWRQIIGYAVVALGASALATGFSRRTR